jgi:nucleotide sugar dehydrogenase
MKIGIIGIGFVGNAIMRFFEKKIEKKKLLLYDKYKNGGIGSFTDILDSDILYLCLPTLYSEEKKCYDTSALIETINKLNTSNFLGSILIKSTVEPLFCEKLNREYKKLKIIHNPEFLSARTAVKDFENTKQIIIGHTSQEMSIDSASQVELFYRDMFPNSIINICSSTESEIMKICVNSFYSVKIQFFNEIYDLCKKTDSDYNIIKKCMLNNGWINSQHTSVPGHDGKLSYGGACFPKDTNALLQFMKSNNILHKVLEATIEERNEIRK